MAKNKDVNPEEGASDQAPFYLILHSGVGRHNRGDVVQFAPEVDIERLLRFQAIREVPADYVEPKEVPAPTPTAVCSLVEDFSDRRQAQQAASQAAEQIAEDVSRADGSEM